MKKLTTFIFVVTLFLLVSTSTSGEVSAFSGEGAGIEGDPYLINTCDELQEVDDALDAYYKLNNDINTDECTDPFTTLAAGSQFTGNFNGNGNTITLNLINQPGLFQTLSSAIVYNLGLAGNIINGSDYTGSLAAAMGNGAEVYGIASIVNIHVVDILNDDYVGGLVGDGSNSYIHDSYFIGDVTGANNVGGIIGSVEGDFSVENTYSAGTITGNYGPGGIIGSAANFGGDLTFNNNFSASALFSTSHYVVSGLIGVLEEDPMSFENNYYNSNQLDVNGSLCTSYDSGGIDPSNMSGCSIENDNAYYKGYKDLNLLFNTWDFDTIWIFQGYPKLRGVELDDPNYIVDITGEGTQEDPFLLDNCGDLLAIKDDLSAHYKLASNITCPDLQNGIGAMTESAFTGSLDGSNFTISYSQFGYVNKGLFYGLNNAIIYNLFLNAEIRSIVNDSGVYDIGGLAVYASNSEIHHITGTFTYDLEGVSVWETTQIGGLLGTSTESSIHDIEFETNIQVQVSSDINRTGGLVGFSYETNYNQISLDGSIDILQTGEDYSYASSIGGVIGYDDYNSTITKVDSDVVIDISSIEDIDNEIYRIGGVVGAFAQDGCNAVCYITESRWNGEMFLSGIRISDIGGLAGDSDSDSHYYRQQSRNNHVEGNFNIIYYGSIYNIGGLYGDLDETVIQFSSFKGVFNIEATGENDTDITRIGGLAGSIDFVSIWDSYANIDFDINAASNDPELSDLRIGGLVGSVGFAEIKSSYASGTIKYEDSAVDSRGIGGLVGEVWDELGIENSFSAVQLDIDSDVEYIGGIVGYNDSYTYFNNVYFDRELAMVNPCIGNGDDNDDEGCQWVNGENSNPNYFKGNTTNNPLDKWKFLTVWEEVANDYPKLYSLPMAMSSNFVGGSGSVENPYEIATCEGLQDLGIQPSLNYILVSDIDCEGVNFNPIGSNEQEVFTGVLNGDGYTINNINIENSHNYSGVFGVLYDAHIHDTGFENIIVSGYEEVGGLAGIIENESVIENITMDVELIDCVLGCGGIAGKVNDDADGLTIFNNLRVDINIELPVFYPDSVGIGGVIGYAKNINMSYVEVKGDIDVWGSQVYEVGGFVGYIQSENLNSNYSINNSYSQVRLSVYGEDIYSIGSFAGSIYNTTLNNVYSTGILVGEADLFTGIGGLAGQSSVSIINNSYSASRVNFSANEIQNTGGLVGYAYGENEYNNVFSASIIETESDTSGNVSGLIGAEDGNVTLNGGYFDNNLVNDLDCMGNDSLPLVTCTKIEEDPLYFKNNNTNAPLDEWDFEPSSNIWAVSSSYPILANFDVNQVFNHGQNWDSDDDGIFDNEEDSAPNDGDANNDGVLDSEQSNVASFYNSLTSSYTSIETTCYQIYGIQLGSESTENPDTIYNYDLGLLGYYMDCNVEGIEYVHIYYYGNFDSTRFTVRKWSDIYKTIPDSTFENTIIDGENVMRMIYQINDGGELDDAQEEEGVIYHIVGAGESDNNIGEDDEDPDVNENQNNQGSNNGGNRQDQTIKQDNSAADNTANKIILNSFIEYLTSSGKSLSLKVGQVIYFTIVNNLGNYEEHSVTVKEITSDYVTVTIASTPAELKLSINQKVKHDVDEDGDQDIEMMLISTTDSEATINFRQLDRESLVKTSDSIPDPQGDNGVNALEEVPSNFTLWILVALVVLGLIIFIVLKKKRTKDKPLNLQKHLEKI